MRAAWYDRTGQAAEVLAVYELPDPHPGPGELRVRVYCAGLNPRDVNRGAGLGDQVMTDPRVVAGDDGAGVVDEVGEGVDAARLGQRVWIYFANYLRPFGTMAEFVVIPADRAVELPEIATFAEGACLGVPACACQSGTPATSIWSMESRSSAASARVSHRYAVESRSPGLPSIRMLTSFVVPGANAFSRYPHIAAVMVHSASRDSR